MIKSKLSIPSESQISSKRLMASAKFGKMIKRYEPLKFLVYGMLESYASLTLLTKKRA